jgi:hypothetical protein
VNYPRDTDLFGIPERINSFNLRDTIDTYLDYEYEPYRLYNSDHFEDIYSSHSLYGTMPIMHARQDMSEVTTGFLWANASDTFIDILKSN